MQIHSRNAFHECEALHKPLIILVLYSVLKFSDLNFVNAVVLYLARFISFDRIFTEQNCP
jgi:hypothetical protein